MGQGVRMTLRTGSGHGGFRGFEKSQWVEFLPQKKTVDLGAHRGLVAGATHDGGADRKVVIERLCLSLLHVKKPLNSKVIKSFVPELRSHKCFLCFGIPMLSMCIMDIMNISHTGMSMFISRIHGWLCDTSTFPTTPGLESHCQMLLCHNQDTCCGVLLPVEI